MAIWNAGTQTIRRPDIPEGDPLRIVSKSGASIIRSKLLESSREANRVSLSSISSSEIPDVSFEFLDPGDGLLVEVTHTGLKIDQIALVGSVMGGRVVRTAADPEYTVTSAPQNPTPIYTTESYRASHLSFVNVAFYLLIICGLVAIISAALGFTEVAFVFSMALAILFVLRLGTKLYVTRTYPPPSIKIFDNDL